MFLSFFIVNLIPRAIRSFSDKKTNLLFVIMKIDEYLKTDEGQEHMQNRSIQAEGTFTNIKQDFEYVRLRRRGESGVVVDLGLVCIGYNLRKYHNQKVATKMN